MIEKVLMALLLSASPLGELRSGLPFAFYHNVDPLTAFLVCVLGNMLVVPIMYFLLNNVHTQFAERKGYRRYAGRLLASAQFKTRKLVRKYGFWGLMVFVMVPLPVTGAYMGAIAAWAFKMPVAKSFTAIALGVLISGLIVFGILSAGVGIYHKVA